MPVALKPLNRFEVKYLVATRAIPALAGELAEYVVPDPHAKDPRGYGVFSLYWDSADFRLFWEKIEGYKDRSKLRLRRYVGGEDVFLEIKQREDRTLQKRRAMLSVAEAGRFAEGVAPAWDAEAAVVRAAQSLIERHRLFPRVGILYRRLALFGAFDPELRVTFDSRLMYRTSDLDIANPFATGKYLLDPRVAVMEIKYNHRAPVWLTKLARRRELKLVRMSKYCTAVDREYYRHQLT